MNLGWTDILALLALLGALLTPVAVFVILDTVGRWLILAGALCALSAVWVRPRRALAIAGIEVLLIGVLALAAGARIERSFAQNPQVAGKAALRRVAVKTTPLPKEPAPDVRAATTVLVSLVLCGILLLVHRPWREGPLTLALWASVALLHIVALVLVENVLVALSDTTKRYEKELVTSRRLQTQLDEQHVQLNEARARETEHYLQQHATAPAYKPWSGNVGEKMRELILGRGDFAAGEVTPTADLKRDLKLDEVALVDLIMAVEEEFGIDIPVEDTDSFRRVIDITTYIEQRLQQRP